MVYLMYNSDEVHDRIVSRTLSIAPVDRDKLRRFYEGRISLSWSLLYSFIFIKPFLIQFKYFIWSSEQKEDSFIHPEPVFPDDKTPAFEEASFNVFKLKKL